MITSTGDLRVGCSSRRDWHFLCAWIHSLSFGLFETGLDEVHIEIEHEVHLELQKSIAVCLIVWLVRGIVFLRDS